MKCYLCKEKITSSDYFSMQKKGIAFILYFHAECFDSAAGKGFGVALLAGQSQNMCLLCGEKPSTMWNRKTCADCSIKAPECLHCSHPNNPTQMILRITKNNNTPFWGCKNYPTCKGTISI